MKQTWTSEKIEERDSKIGRGAFAIAPISEYEPVAVWGGIVCRRSEFSALPAIFITNAVQIGLDDYLVQPLLVAGDRINHSCEPNCGMAGDRTLVAMRQIAVGEEITYDYAMSDASDYDEFLCRCGCATCRGKITGLDWKDPVLRRRYSGFLSSFIEGLIREEQRALVRSP